MRPGPKSNKALLALKKKLPGEWRSGKHQIAVVVVDDIPVTVVPIPAHGSKEISPGSWHSICKSLRLTDREARALVDCRLSGTGFEDLIRSQRRTDAPSSTSDSDEEA